MRARSSSPRALRKRRSRHTWAALALGVLGGQAACTEAVRLGENPVSAAGAAGDTAGGGAGSAAGGFGGAFVGGSPDAAVGAGAAGAGVDAGPCVPVVCGGGAPRACGNCVDDDGDGRIDAADPECLGPCDDDESGLFAGFDARVNASCRADCFFDANAGFDEGCSWPYACEPLAVAPDFPPTGVARCAYAPEQNDCASEEQQSDACRAACLPLTPNGCDCFGCCELPAGSGEHVWLGACGSDDADPSACPRCTPVPGCNNPCETCEICVGKPELPASCAASGVAAPACPTGLSACDPLAGLGCSSVEYCITGCCVPLPR